MKINGNDANNCYGKNEKIMSSDEMKAWDEKFNCVDEVYSLEKMN